MICSYSVNIDCKPLYFDSTIRRQVDEAAPNKALLVYMTVVSEELDFMKHDAIVLLPVVPLRTCAVKTSAFQSVKIMKPQKLVQC